MSLGAIRLQLFCLAGCLLAVTLTPPAEAAFVRANCQGIQKFSTTDDEVSCRESNVLSDEAGNVMLGHTRASASLSRGLLSASAAGGQIRDVGANGGEAGALLKGRLTVAGSWEGSLPVAIRLCVAYRFAGFGESRIHATLRGRRPGDVSGASQARVRLAHRGFRGATLENFESRGEFEIPPEGPKEASASFALGVTGEVTREAPSIDVRADIVAHALPNLEALEPVLSSFGQAVAWIAVSLPDHLELRSESGRFLTAPFDPEAGAAAGGRRTWVIMAAAFEGRRHALRGHRHWHRVCCSVRLWTRTPPGWVSTWRWPVSTPTSRPRSATTSSA